jgi:putative transposase
LKQSRFTEEQINRLLQRADGGEKIADLWREAGISNTTFQRWKAKYGGLEVNEARPLKQLERVYRLYRAERLQAPRRRRKRVALRQQPSLAVNQQANQQRAMDVVHDAAATGHAFRAPTLIDTYTRECHTIEVARLLPSARVIRVLDRLLAQHGSPACIRVDQGPECISRALNQWATRPGIQLHHIPPGNPMENGHSESFNGTFRDECLNQHWFLDLGDAQQLIEAWRTDDTTNRPYSALGALSPACFAQQCRQIVSDPLGLDRAPGAVRLGCVLSWHTPGVRWPC